MRKGKENISLWRDKRKTGIGSLKWEEKRRVKEETWEEPTNTKGHLKNKLSFYYCRSISKIYTDVKEI